MFQTQIQTWQRDFWDFLVFFSHQFGVRHHQHLWWRWSNFGFTGRVKRGARKNTPLDAKLLLSKKKRAARWLLVKSVLGSKYMFEVLFELTLLILQLHVPTEIAAGLMHKNRWQSIFSIPQPKSRSSCALFQAFTFTSFILLQLMVSQDTNNVPPAKMLNLGILHLTSKQNRLHPRKLTWNLKMKPWKRRFLLKTIIFRFHVSFRGGRSLCAELPKNFCRDASPIFTHFLWWFRYGSTGSPNPRPKTNVFHICSSLCFWKFGTCCRIPWGFIPLALDNLGSNFIQATHVDSLSTGRRQEIKVSYSPSPPTKWEDVFFRFQIPCNIIQPDIKKYV